MKLIKIFGGRKLKNQDWEILYELYRHNNVTKTAKVMNLSQPALTRRLKQIEEEFQVKVVYRSKQGVHFTPEGEYLAKSAETVLKEYEKTKEQLWNMNDELVGTLKIGVANFLTSFMLFDFINSFKKLHPNVDFKITTGWSQDMYNLVYNNDVHISFVRGDYSWNENKHFLFEETLSIISKSKIDIDDLPNLPRIDYHTDAKLKALIDNWWGENYVQSPYITMVVDKAKTSREMVLNDLGYAILPSLVVRDLGQLYKKVIKNRYGEPILRRSWMLYHEESMNLKVVKEFVQFVKQSNFKVDM